MPVYIECVIIDNLIFDYLLLSLALKGKGRATTVWRILISSILGTIVAVIFPLLKIHQIFLFSIKILLAFVMVLVAGKFSNFKKYLLSVNNFLLYTFLFGGIFFGIFYLIGKDYSFLYGTSSSIFPLGIMILIGIILFKIFNKIYKIAFEKKIIYPFIRKCQLFSNGEKIEVEGLIDSGNHLIFENDRPVCVSGGKLTEKMFLTGFLNEKKRGEMQLSTISGSGILKIYEIDEIRIYCGNKVNIINKPLIAISLKNNDLSEDYQLILSSVYGVENH